MGDIPPPGIDRQRGFIKTHSRLEENTQPGSWESGYPGSLRDWLQGQHQTVESCCRGVVITFLSSSFPAVPDISHLAAAV